MKNIKLLCENRKLVYFKIVQRKQEVLIMSTQFTSDKEKIDKSLFMQNRYIKKRI